MRTYLDHAATTPMNPAAIEAYARAATQVGNASSIHSAGQNAKRMLEDARERIAATLGCDGIEIVFTSGGTEAVNLAIKGLYGARRASGADRILVPDGEHHATVDTVEWLASSASAQAEWLPLDTEGFVRLDALDAALARDPATIALLSFLWANNEVGTVEPVERILALATRAGVPAHVDAVSAHGHLPIGFQRMRAATGSAGTAGLVAMSVSAHKIGGPVGIGALVLSREASVVPLIHGGGQQRQVRSGTQDVPAAVAFAVAAEEAERRRESESVRLTGLRDRLIAGVRAAVPEAVLSGPDPGSGGERRLASNAHFVFPGCEGDSLLFLLDAAGIDVSTGSACQAGIPEPSHVLRAMGRDDGQARGALRITLGATSTDEDIDAFLAALPGAFDRASDAGLATRTSAFGAR